MDDRFARRRGTRVISAVDTNVLLDVFGADSAFGRLSADALRSALVEGALIACPVVWAEVATAFPDTLPPSTPWEHSASPSAGSTEIQRYWRQPHGTLTERPVDVGTVELLTF